jgi:hypothetical protein
MKIFTSLSKNWSKVKSWLKAEQSANRIDTKHIVIEPNDAKEVKTIAFRPVFHPGGYYNSNPYFPGTNENRKRKHNKLHKNRMLRKKHRKAA